MKGESIEDILIIGAGPSGLFVAAELARHGVRARLIEKDLTPHAQSRATGVQPATLEVLQRAGMLDGLLAAAQRIDGMQILDGRLEPAFATSLAGMDTPYSFVASLPQCRTESLLEAHLRRLGGAPERGVLVEGVELDAAGSRVAVRHADGTRESIYARYLIGAGGAHCPVRAAMHEHLDGTTYPFRYLVADISGDIRLDPHTLCVAISCVGIVMLVPLPAERWLAVIDLPDGSCQQTFALSDVSAALELHLAEVPALAALHWSSLFHTHRRIAPRFADGRRFLLGDAAHICSPFGGEGMNAGLQDGADLAWKLALVTKGLARPSVLDAYDAERRGVAAQVLASSDVARNHYYQMVEMAACDQPITPPSTDASHPVTATSMLDLSWCDSPIVGAFHSGGELGRPRPGERFRDRAALDGTMHHLIVFPGPRTASADLDGFRRRWARHLEVLDLARLSAGAAERAGLEHGGALLVRPDGFVGFRAETWNAEALGALDAHLAGHFTPA